MNIAVLPFLIAFGLVVVVPVVAILTSHFQKIAEIKAQSAQQNSEQGRRIAELESRFDLINEKLNTLILANDRSPYASSDAMIERLEDRPRA